MKPMISVVIPTAYRPQWLPRAVDSALSGLSTSEVEVIVVPNGADVTWANAMERFKKNRAVRVLRVREANANVARNVGLHAARGELVRFLDDDDYLCAAGSNKQYDVMQSTGADIVSGSVELRDEKNNIFDVWNQPKFDDYVEAMLGPWRRCQPTAHVYRTKSVNHLTWNPKSNFGQDVEWAINLAASKEFEWIKINDIVGVWSHHGSSRVSTSRNFNAGNVFIHGVLMTAYKHLNSCSRLNDFRKKALIQGLWQNVHSSMFLSPLFWMTVVKQIKHIDASIRPHHPIYNLPVLRYVDPLVIQYILIPKRWFLYIRNLYNHSR